MATYGLGRHTDRWYDELAKSLGHPGYLTLAEIRKADTEEQEDSDG